MRTFSYLGVKLDESLEWNHHTETICKKVAAGIRVMKRIKPYVSAYTLQTIYSALIQPYFDYCLPLWRVCNKTLKDELQKFQNRAAKIIAEVSLDTRSADVLCSPSRNELEERRRISKSLLVYKILNDYTGPNLKESLIRRNIWQTNYDLRNSQTDLALQNQKGSFSKKNLIIVGQNCGTVFHRMPN